MRAIVATNAPGCSDVVRHEENGLLAPVRDPEASAAVLRYVIEAPTLRRQMGVRVQAIVQQEFFKEKVVAENPRGLPGAVDVKRVLVTGANGFVGLNTCRVLREGGFMVRAAVRRADRLPARLSKDEIAVAGDISPDTDWEPVLEGVSAVVHLAGRVHVLRETVLDPQGEFYKANVDGTERLARAAASAGVRRFVYVSSIGVNGKSTHGKAFTEGYMPSPHNSYAISKWEAEQALRRVAEETGLGVTVLRPPLIYGPGVKANFLRLMRLVNRGLPMPLRSIDNRRSLIYVGNLANAIAVCLDHPKAAGETFLVSDGEDIATPELICRIARSLGRPARLLPFPPSLLRAVGNLTKQSASIEPLLDSLEVDSGKIVNTLRWQPPYTMVKGLEETAKWFVGEA